MTGKTRGDDSEKHEGMTPIAPCHSHVPYCHSRAGGNPAISIDPRFHGDDSEKHEGMTLQVKC
jgi:hypothetical protein